VPDPSAFKLGVDAEKLRRHNSPGINQISAELIKAGDKTIRSEIHKLINSVWNNEELPMDLKESSIVPIFKKGVKTNCSNYTGLSNLSSTYKISSNILLSRITPDAEEFSEDQHCGFRRNT
jgi:hypothetical protein